MKVRIRDVMTMPAVTVTERSTLGAAVELLNEEQLGSLTVVDEHGTPLARMTLDVSAVRPDDDVATVAELMRSTRTPTLPVVDGSRVVGTVTLDCLLAALRDDEAPDPYHRRRAEVSAGTSRPRDHS